MRFWGWTENEREQKKDLVELSKRAQKGLPLYGESQLDPFYQQTAANNSRYAALKLCNLSLTKLFTITNILFSHSPMVQLC